MYRTYDEATYKQMKEAGYEIELVSKTLLDVFIHLSGQVAPRNKINEREYEKYYLLYCSNTEEEIIDAINDFDENIKFKIEPYDKCFDSYKISILN